MDEAAAQLVAARLLPEGGNSNVSQTINLASLYNDMGKPKEAQQTLAEISEENTSGYGAMQAAIERVASADQLGDSVEVEKQLGFLREHQGCAAPSPLHALRSSDCRSDRAARVLGCACLILHLSRINSYSPAALCHHPDPQPPTSGTNAKGSKNRGSVHPDFSARCGNCELGSCSLRDKSGKREFHRAALVYPRQPDHLQFASLRRSSGWIPTCSRLVELSAQGFRPNLVLHR